MVRRLMRINISLEVSDEGLTIQARCGDEIVLRLTDYPAGSGYRWTVGPPEGESAEFVEQSRVLTASAPGSAAEENFVYRAVRGGRTELHFNLSRPWETTPITTKFVVVDVGAPDAAIA